MFPLLLLFIIWLFAAGKWQDYTALVSSASASSSGASGGLLTLPKTPTIGQ